MPDARPYARLKEGLFPVGLLVFTVFIFAPFTIYFWNPGELDVGYFSVLTTLSPLALLAAVVLLIPACLLPARGFRFYNPLLLGLGVALWLQGSVMVGSYGLLDGTRIDFAAQNWRAWHETAVWAGLPALVIIFYPGHKRTMLSGARLVLSLEVLFVVAGGLAYPASFKPWELDSLPADASVLSSRDNILHIVLDGFQSDAFAEVLERFPEFADAFEGFVFYENSMGLFPTTRMSIPAMLTGEVYRNQVPMDEFISVVMSSRTLPATLHQSGYLVDMLTLRQYRYGEDYSNWYSVPRPFSAEKQRRRFAAAEVLDLSLFRHLPHLVKPWIYRNQSWLLQAWGPLNVPADRKFAPSNSVAFMQHYRSRLRVGDEQPRYKFIHLFLPHLPLVLDSGCKFLGTRPQSREAFVEQSACAVRVVSDFLNDLRARGVYENALIVISADHGNRFPSELVSSQFEDAQVASRATALLLIKTPGAREELVTSAAPVTLSDIPATIAELTGIPNRFPGRSALQLRAGDRRDRRFYYYIWRGGYWNYDFLPELREYVVSGDVFDPGAWQFQGLVQPREGAPESSFIRVDLGTERHRKFLESGWGRDRKNGKTTYVRAIGKTARVRLPLISQADTLVTARLAPAPEDRTQVISVVVDGKEITRWKANPGSGWRVYSAIIPTSSRIRREVTIQFNFAEVSSPDNLAAGFDYIEAKPTPPPTFGVHVRTVARVPVLVPLSPRDPSQPRAMIRKNMLEVVSDVEVLLDEQAVQRRVREMGAQLTRDLEGLSPLFIAILRGAAIFHADLVRQVDLMLKVDYISVKSYGDATESSGEVRLVKDLESSIRGEDVVLVDDIVDTGLTVRYLLRSLQARQPRSLRVCTLLSKPARRQTEVEIDYIGFEVPDRFVVGYGLDYAENYRNLPYVGVLSDPEP